jgi:DNA-binding NarL/FixJ family response regulator
MPDLVRVVIVDDHQMFRSGVRAELGTAVDVVGEAGDVSTAVAVIEETTPDVVLLDVHLPGGEAEEGGGTEVLRRVSAPGTKFLALSVSDAAEDVIGVVRAGARGYVTKTISGRELAAAITRVAAGDAVFSPRLAGFVLDAFTGGAPDPELDSLTTRERQVLRLIARGYAYKEIARELTISIKTVESHVSSVLRKLQLSSSRELSRWANARRLALPHRNEQRFRDAAGAFAEAVGGAGGVPEHETGRARPVAVQGQRLDEDARPQDASGGLGVVEGGGRERDEQVESGGNARDPSARQEIPQCVQQCVAAFP